MTKRGQRGQITFFIALGVIVLVIFGTLLFLATPPVETPVWDQSTEFYFQQCHKQAAEYALFQVSKRGGLLFVTPPAVETDGVNVPYYYVDGKEAYPSEATISDALSKTADVAFINCLYPLPQGIIGELKKLPTTQASIHEQDVRFVTDILFTHVEIGEKDITTAATTVPSSLSRLLGISKEVVASHVQQKMICVTCIQRLAEQNNVVITAQPAETGTAYTITDFAYNLRGDPFALAFAVQ